VPEDNEREELITLNAESADDSNTEAVDRGDNFTGDEPAAEPAAEEAVDLDALKAVAEEEPKVEEEHKTEARIPKARFDEVNARMKQAEAEKQALEAQLRALQQPQAAPAAQAPAQAGQVDLDAAEEAYLEALRQGDGTRARQIRGAINQHIQQQAEAAAVARVSAVMDKRETETSLVAVANESIQKYPFLNAESDQANEEAIAEVVEWRDYYAAKGMRADVALQKAVAKIVPMYAPKPKAAPEPEPEPKVDIRAKEAIQRNALAANAQPAPLAGVGERASKARYDVSKMTDEEFEALPASERKRMRGDA
jgi:hypothetical protein